MPRRLVLDTNVYISALLSTRGPNAQLVARAQRGEIELVVSGKLLDELHTRLEREKFRRWVSLGEVEDFVAAVTLLGHFVEDRPDEQVPLVCADPDDNFLVALAQDADAQMLVSGDKKVLAIEYPGIHVYTAADALEALAFTHDWGEEFVPGDPAAIQRQIESEGAKPLIQAYSFFSVALRERDARRLLPFVVVPEALPQFLRGLKEVRGMIENRGMATRPIYASPDIAYLKLPPDPAHNLRATGDVALPGDTIFATLQHCPDLVDADVADFDRWRIFAIGEPVRPEHIRPRQLPRK